MNRGSAFFYLFRFVAGFIAIVLLAMLYYSSYLIEKDVKSIKEELSEIQKLYSREGGGSFSTPLAYSEESSSVKPLLFADSTLPNLLTEDSFYRSTLPQLLPESFVPYGVMRYGEIGKPENFHPFSGWNVVTEAQRRCLVSVARLAFGRYETFAPCMALKIEERPVDGGERTEYWVFLRGDVYWQPLRQSFFPSTIQLDSHFLKRHQVTAHDFKFYWDAVMNPHVQMKGGVAIRSSLGDIEEFRVIDDLTFVVRWRSEPVVDPFTGEVRERTKYMARPLTGSLYPLPTWLYQYFPDGEKIIDDLGESDAYRTHSVWAQNFSQHWAQHIIPSCGAWIYDGASDNEIRFRRNPDHFEPYAALTDKMTIRFRESPDGIWQDFKAGNIDTWDSTLVPEKLLELPDFMASAAYQQQVDRGAAIERIDYLDRSYRYIAWNFRTPFFRSKRVRQAMTMAIDCDRIIQRILNGMGERFAGPFFPGDTTEYNREIELLPYDPIEAVRLLEEEGWYDSDGDGVRDKVVDGKREPFRFRLFYFVKSTTARVVCDYVATSLREIGIDCIPNGVDTADLTAAIDGKEFDALYLAWALGTPPSDPKQLWHSSGAWESGSSNTISFVNLEVDRLIDELQYLYDPDERRSHYHRIHEIIYEEAPYTFLSIPKVALLYRDYLQQLFIPAERQDLVPGADIQEPSLTTAWIREPE